MVFIIQNVIVDIQRDKNIRNEGDVLVQILDEINQPNDIKKTNPEDFNKLAYEIRRFLVKNISKTGGHLASNLGAVELTMALHLFLDFPEDRLVWDVGHQAYTHKLLTGRKNEFTSLRTFEGLSGFPKRKESSCDSFDTGHSSTSISAALGLVKARDLQGKDHKVVAVIGDGALSGGMAFEALNNAARLNTNLTIILNDNNMSISENVGGMANYLGKLRTGDKYKNFKIYLEKIFNKVPGVGPAIIEKLKKSKDSLKGLVIPGMLFEDMGITYIGPIDGHNINELNIALLSAAKMEKAVLIHVLTKKGKGYKPAEENPSKYHGVEAFDIRTGKNNGVKKGPSYTDIFSETMIELGEKNNNIVAITAAMPSGTGLNSFMERFPERFFDVGIAEEHAVTYAAGLALGGMKPYVAIYSTFLQRAYDQILHDVCISNLPVVFAIDRAGLVGNDGETHQGMFDISYLSHIPNLTLMVPKNGLELKEMLYFAEDFNGPVAIRYPRGKAYEGFATFNTPIKLGKSEALYTTICGGMINQGNLEIMNPSFEKERTVLLTLGSMVESAAHVYEELAKKGQEVTLINVRFVKPMDEALLHALAKTHGKWITFEENIKAGGFGEKIAAFLLEHDYGKVKLLNISLPNQFIEQGDVEVLKEKLELNDKSIVQKVLLF